MSADIQDGQRRRNTRVLFSWLPAGHKNQMIHGFFSAHQMFLPYIQLFTFCINHTSISPPNKSGQSPSMLKNPIALPENLAISARLFNQVLRAFSSFGGSKLKATRTPPLKTPTIASTIVKIVIKIAESIDTIVMPCSTISYKFFPLKIISPSRTFSMVCLILATCVQRSFQFFVSTLSVARCSVFKSL